MTGGRKPNIVISGTPGTGKTTLAKKLVELLPEHRVIHLGAEAEMYAEAHPEARVRKWHEQSNSYEIDEDKLVDILESRMQAGGNIVDWIHADFWSPECKIDLVVTLRTDNELLYDRYSARGYSQSKIDENLDAEIFGSIAEENQDYYKGEDAEIDAEVFELRSNTDEDMRNNLSKIVAWVEAFLQTISDRNRVPSSGTND